MFNKFKSAFYNVVGSFDLSNEGQSPSGSSGIASPPLELNGASLSKQNSKNLKYPYKRPIFLQLNSEEEILVTADHAIRPIICPRNISNLPWNTGYAETVNAGKTKKNEDQAAVFIGHLTKSIPNWSDASPAECKSESIDNDSCETDLIKTNPDKSSESQSTSSGGPPKESTADKEPSQSAPMGGPSKESAADKEPSQSAPRGGPSKKSAAGKDPSESLYIDSTGQLNISLPYYYFAVFDGHAGWGAAVHAANELHEIIHEKLSENLDLLLPETSTSYQQENLHGPLWFFETAISPENAVIGALEQAFWQMDQQIAQDRLKYQLTGGCTACVGLFILGKLFVSNAGDSRATMTCSGRPFRMSNDFTPETENQRIRSVGATQPELLGGEFTHVEFLRRPLKRDIGKKVLYRDHYMKGWGYKTVTPDDLKYPLVSGEGKRSRVLATIGVTRGFGDHDLKALHCSLPIKPFLTPVPEILIYDFSTKTKEDDCLVLGTDGLWDITSNAKAALSVHDSLKHFPASDHQRYMYRYTSAAQDLVVLSRGKFKNYNWKTAEDKHATIDDITVFTIPLLNYKLEWEAWKAKYDGLLETTTSKPLDAVVPYETNEEPEVADDAMAVEIALEPSVVNDESSIDLSNGTLEPEGMETCA